ncbi:hypothetical protein SynMITS9220_00807 [Synechococcus sp. MIT S9220]|nr:hypothetical protein SynMITS9220_00807 [Synechococcus sp. MIT S9220]
MLCARTGAHKLAAKAEARKTAEDLLRRLLANPFIDCRTERSFFV